MTRKRSQQIISNKILINISSMANFNNLMAKAMARPQQGTVSPLRRKGSETR
jgi:hypothetical protein